MDQFQEITEDIYKKIDIFKTIYEAGNISISNFFEKININKIEAEKKQSIQNGNANDLPPLIYDLCDFHSEFQSKNQINIENFNKLKKGISDLKGIFDELQLSLKDQTQHILEFENDKAQEIQQLKEENSRYLNAFNNLTVESKSDKKTKEQIQELIDENKSLKNKLKSEEKKSREITNSLNDLVKKNHDKDKMISSKDSMIAMRNKKIDDLKKEIENLKSRIKASSKNAPVSQYPQSKRVQLKEPDTSKSRKSVDLSASNNPYKQSFGETQQNALLSQQNRELQQKIHEKDDTIKQLNMQIQSLESQNPTSAPNYQKHKDSFISIDQKPNSKQIPPPDQDVQFYQQLISEKDKEIRQLKEENAALRNDVFQINAQIASLTEQNQVNIQYIEMLKSSISQSGQDSKSHRQQISEKEITQLKQQITQLQQQITLLQQQNCEKENQNKLLSQENQQYRATVSDKNAQVQNLVKQYNDSKSQSDKEHAELSVLRVQVKTISADKDKEIDQLKIEKQNNEKQILKLNQENEKLKNEVDQKKAKYVLENESLNFIGQEQEKLIAKLEEESQNNRNEIEKLNKEKQELEQKSSKLENQNKDLDQKVSELESTNESRSKTITDISNENKKLKLDIENIKRNEERLKKQLESEINKLKKGNNTTQVPHEKSIEILDTDDIQNLEIINEIGYGSGGIIYKVAKKVIYALKKMRPQITHDEFQRFIAEYELMRILEHPNIVKTYGIFMSDGQNPPSILLEYCPSNLDFLINSRQQVTNIDLVFMIYQIVEGMKYVHFRNVVHRDLKPSNILIGEDGTIKIGDFGISKLMSSGEQMTQGRGTFHFMAPEILNQTEYNEKVDVYAFGVILFFILSGGLMPNITIIQVGTGQRAQIPDTFTELSSQLISSCWNFNPNDRPSFEQIYNEIENNDFKLIEMDETEIDEVKKMIKNHKEKIPNY